MVQQLRCRTTDLLQSLDDGIVGVYADLDLCPCCLVRRTGQFRMGLLQVGLGSLKIGRATMWNRTGKQIKNTNSDFVLLRPHHLLPTLLKELLSQDQESGQEKSFTFLRLTDVKARMAATSQKWWSKTSRENPHCLFALKAPFVTVVIRNEKCQT